MDLFTDGGLSRDAIQRKLDELAQQKGLHEQRLAELQREKEPAQLGDQALENFEAYATTIREGLDTLSFEDRQTVLRELIDHIDVDAPNRAQIHIRLPHGGDGGPAYLCQGHEHVAIDRAN